MSKRCPKCGEIIEYDWIHDMPREDQEGAVVALVLMTIGTLIIAWMI